MKQLLSSPIHKSKWQAIIILILIGEIIGILLLQDRLFVPTIWKAVDWSPEKYEVRAATISKDNDPWLIQKMLWGTDYQLLHITNGKTVSWKLPSITSMDLIGAKIIIGEDDNPWLFLGEKLAHLENDQWITYDTPLGASIGNYTCPSIVSMGSKIWGIDNITDGSRLIQLNLSQQPIQASEISVPSDLMLGNYRFDSIISANDSGILAFLSNETEILIYHFLNNDWQKTTSFQKSQKSNVYLADTLVDSDGQIWVLVVEWIHGSKVGKYDPRNNTWVWFDIEHPINNDNHLEYHDIEVDRLGRVWMVMSEYVPTDKTIVGGSGETENFTFNEYSVGVFQESQNNSLMEIRHYTLQNSGVETSLVSHLLLGSDGKVWTWNKQLVWIDSETSALPSTIPIWISSISRLKIAYGFLVFVLLLIAGSVVVSLKGKK